MKIVNIILTSQNGGAEQVFIDYSNILKNRLGHQLLTIVKTDAPYCDKIESLGIEAKKIKNNFGFHDVFAVKSIKKILEDFDADAVLTHAGRATVLARKAIKKIKHKKIFEVAMNHSNNVKRSVGADLIISINKSIFYKTVDLGQEPEKSFTISNAIDTSNISPNFDKINFDKDTITIGMMSRFDRTKGYFELIKALKILNEKQGKKFVLKIAGSGYFQKEIEKMIKNLKMENYIEFLGWIKNKKEFFDSIDIFVLPSLEEPFGLVILESMHHSTPIVSSNCDGPLEILQPEIEAEFFATSPYENIENRLADAILKLSQDDERARKMAQNAFKKLQERFSFDSLEKNLKEIFGRVPQNKN